MAQFPDSLRASCTLVRLVVCFCKHVQVAHMQRGKRSSRLVAWLSAGRGSRSPQTFQGDVGDGFKSHELKLLRDGGAILTAPLGAGSRSADQTRSGGHRRHGWRRSLDCFGLASNTQAMLHHVFVER